MALKEFLERIIKEIDDYLEILYLVIDNPNIQYISKIIDEYKNYISVRKICVKIIYTNDQQIAKESKQIINSIKAKINTTSEYDNFYHIKFFLL